MGSLNATIRKFGQHRLARPMALAAASNGIVSVLGMVTMLLLAHNVGAEVFGAFGAIVALAAMTGRILSPSTAYWLPKAIADTKERASSLLYLLNIVVLIEFTAVIVAACLTCVLSARFLGAAHAHLGTATIALLVFSTTVSLLPSQAIFMRVLHQDQSLALRILAMAAGRILIVVTCITLQCPPARTIASISVFDLITFGILVLLTRTAVTDADRRGQVKAESWTRVLPGIWTLRKDTLQAWFNSIVKGLHRDLDILLVSKLGGLEAAAVVKMSKAVVIAAMRLTDPIYNVLVAHYATERSTAAGSTAARESIRTAHRMLPWAVAAAFVAIPMASLLIARMLHVAGSFNLTLAVAGYALGASLACATVSWQPLLLATHGPAGIVRTTLMAAVVQIATLFCLVPVLGPAGCAIAYLLFYAVWTANTQRTLIRMQPSHPAPSAA